MSEDAATCVEELASAAGGPMSIEWLRGVIADAMARNIVDRLFMSPRTFARLVLDACPRTRWAKRHVRYSVRRARGQPPRRVAVHGLALQHRRSR